MLVVAKTQGNFFPRSWQDPGKEFPWVLVKIFLILTFFDKMSGISPRVILLISLSSLPGNGPIPWCGKIGTGKNRFPQESRKAHFIFPMNGLAGMVKINFPMSGEATNGEIYFYHDC